MPHPEKQAQELRLEVCHLTLQGPCRSERLQDWSSSSWKQALGAGFLPSFQPLGEGRPCPALEPSSMQAAPRFGLAWHSPNPALPVASPQGGFLRKVRSQGNAREGLWLGGTPYPDSSCANMLLMVPHGVSWLAPSHCEKLTNSQTLTPICKLVEEM